MSKPTIYYFPIRGRAEVMKLALACKNVEFDVVAPDYQQMKTDKAAYPFGQAPRFTDADINICQSNTILRYIARKWGLDGASEADKVAVDMAMEAVESLRQKYVALIYQDQLSDAGKVAFLEAHVSKASVDGRNGGAHVDYLEWFLRKGNTDFITGSSVTMGDLAIWEMTDLLQRIFPEELKATYPTLMAHFERVAALPGVKEYLAGPLRLEQVNNNKLG